MHDNSGRPARSLGSFAAEQATYLKTRLELGSNGDLAQVNIVKLAEEAGEVAGAYLALLDQQRSEKLRGSLDERRAELSREIGDVVATAVILAHVVGLDVDTTLASRFDELEDRRVAWARQLGSDGLGSSDGRNT